MRIRMVLFRPEALEFCDSFDFCPPKKGGGGSYTDFCVQFPSTLFMLIKNSVNDQTAFDASDNCAKQWFYIWLEKKENFLEKGALRKDLGRDF